jgi:hypothetical protein
MVGSYLRNHLGQDGVIQDQKRIITDSCVHCDRTRRRVIEDFPGESKVRGFLVSNPPYKKPAPNFRQIPTYRIRRLRKW